MIEGEEHLIRQAQSGHAESFGMLYNHYTPPIYRFIYMKVSHRQEAEDITHEVFMKAWQHLPRYQSKGHPFSSWLYQIARNRVIDHYRLKRIHTPLEKAPTAHIQLATTIDADLDINFDVAKVREVLTELTADQQDMILLKFTEELSHREIANIMDKSEGAIRLMQFRAIAKLRKLLKEHKKHNNEDTEIQTT